MNIFYSHTLKCSMEKMKVIQKEETDLFHVLYSLGKLWKEVAIFMMITEEKMQMLWKGRFQTSGLMVRAIITTSFKQPAEVNTGTATVKTLKTTNLTFASSTGRKTVTITTTVNIKSLQMSNYNVKTKVI